MLLYSTPRTISIRKEERETDKGQRGTEADCVALKFFLINNFRGNIMRQIRSYLPSLAATAGVVASLLTLPAWAVTFTPTNLVTDDQLAHAAQITDPHLKNAWGMSYAPGVPGAPFWVSSNGDATVRLYSVNPATQATAPRSLTVSIPGEGSVTGQVFNGTSSFGSFGSNRFLFKSLNRAIIIS